MKGTAVYFLAGVTMLVGFPLMLALVITKRGWKRFAKVLKRTRIPTARSRLARGGNEAARSTEGEPHVFI